MQNAVEIRGLTKRYDGTKALDNVTLDIEQGEVVGFLGPNGAGKTTLIRILFDLIRPTAGSATVLGFDCQRQSVDARRQMGYMPGELRLYDNYKGTDLIELFAALRPGSQSANFAAELCNRLQLDPTKRAGEHSKGNKQKLGLVLALMHKPPLLVLDEPTSGLDPIVQAEIESILAELAAEGHTVFFSSHVLSEVERTCHRVAILRAGRLVAVENIDDLKGHALHLMDVTFSSPAPEGAFDLPGIIELDRHGNEVHLQVQSHLDEAIKTIARFDVVDLRTRQPSIEDVFMTYYREPGPASSEKGADART